jgi:hypothetical protein
MAAAFGQPDDEAARSADDVRVGDHVFVAVEDVPDSRSTPVWTCTTFGESARTSRTCCCWRSAV